MTPLEHLAEMIGPLTAPLIALDVETTGTDHKSARICQIAFQAVYPDGRVKQWASLVNPECPIPASATKVHSITDAQVADAPTFARIGPSLVAGLTGATYIGYNVRFDLDVIKAEAARCALTFDWSAAPVLDPLVVWRMKETRTLTDAVARWLPPHDHHAHDAAADVSSTVEILVAQLIEWPALPRDAGQLHALLFPSNPDAIDKDGKIAWVNGAPCLTFGKHKHVPLQQVERRYLSWLMGQDFSADTKTLLGAAIRGGYPTRVGSPLAAESV